MFGFIAKAGVLKVEACRGVGFRGVNIPEVDGDSSPGKGLFFPLMGKRLILSFQEGGDGVVVAGGRITVIPESVVVKSQVQRKRGLAEHMLQEHLGLIFREGGADAFPVPQIEFAVRGEMHGVQPENRILVFGIVEKEFRIGFVVVAYSSAYQSVPRFLLRFSHDGGGLEVFHRQG